MYSKRSNNKNASSGLKDEKNKDLNGIYGNQGNRYLVGKKPGICKRS